MKNEKKFIFGAGLYGKLALEQMNHEDVIGFLDNCAEKQGTIYCGKKIYSPLVVNDYKDCHVVIASLYSDNMAEQLDNMGFNNYSFYLDEVHGYYEGKQLIVNPYAAEESASTESDWNSSDKISYSRNAVNDAVEKIHDKVPLFNHIEIETINRCNGSCSFCPVNHKEDPREKAVMSDDLFKNIVNQLQEINYSGRFTTFSNNEPLLDDRIVEFNQYAREHLPNARIHMFTNGTLMTLDKFTALTDILDELIIDNYQQELKLIKPCQAIVEYCEKHPALKEKVTIVLRKPKEILTSRGGTAPNRSELIEYCKDRCLLPFKQLIVRPTGQISLCCNDALGKYTLGNASKEKLLDIWYGSKFQMVRKCLYEGRENWGNCKYCDTFSMG